MIFRKVLLVVLCFLGLYTSAQEVTIDSMPARLFEEVEDTRMDTFNHKLYVQTLTESNFNIQSFDIGTNKRHEDFNFPAPQGKKVTWYQWITKSQLLAYITKDEDEISFQLVHKNKNGLWSAVKSLISIENEEGNEILIYSSPNQKFHALQVKTPQNSSLLSTFDADFNFLSFPSHMMKLESVFLSNEGKLILLGANQLGIKTLKVYDAKNGELFNEKILSTSQKQNPKIFDVLWGSIFQYHYNQKENNLYVLQWVHLDYLEIRSLKLKVYELSSYGLEHTFTKRLGKKSFDYGFSIGPTSIENNNVEYPLRLTYKYMETKGSNVYICGTYQRMGKVEGENFESSLSVTKATYFLEFSPQSFWMIPHSQIVINYGKDKVSSEYQRNQEHFDLRTGTFVFYDESKTSLPVLIHNDTKLNYVNAINKYNKTYDGENHSISVVRRKSDDLNKEPLEKHEEKVLLPGQSFFQLSPSIIYGFILNEGKPILVKIQNSYQ